MARDRSPIVKQSRREGYALHPKAHKIMAKRTNIPGQHGGARQSKPSQYALQLREKQKTKRLYGLTEKQFRKLVKEAQRAPGQTGESLLMFLERRADNIVYRAGFARSRRAARQLVNHGHFTLNGRRINIPSIRLAADDVLEVRKKSQSTEYFKSLSSVTQDSISDIPSWVNTDVTSFQINITQLPTREESESGINEQLIVEYYSR